NGEESLPSASASNGQSFSWTAVSGCTNYNVYKQKGSIFGFVAQVQTNSWTDATIDPDIGNTPPQQRNPFGLRKITAVTVQHGGRRRRDRRHCGGTWQRLSLELHRALCRGLRQRRLGRRADAGGDPEPGHLSRVLDLLPAAPGLCRHAGLAADPVVLGGGRLQ